MSRFPAGAQVVTPSGDTLKAVVLYSACTHPAGETAAEHELAAQTCVAYIRGLTDGLFLMRALVEKKSGVCLPEDQPVSLVQARRIFAEWLPAHPQFASNSAGLVVTAAITKAFRCH